MKKFSKLLIVLLVLSVVLAASVIAISASENDTATYTAEDGTEKQDTFANALANAKSGTTVKLEGNGCALEEDYTVTKDITVNLNGKTLTLGSNAKFTFNAKVNFTITGEGKIAIAGALFSSGSGNLNATEEDSTALNVNVLAQGSGIDIVQNASANVNVVYAKSGTWTFKGVNIDAGTTTAQTIKGEGDAKYIFAGCNVKSMGAASQNAYVLQIRESSYVKADWSTFYAAGGAVLNPDSHADKTVADFTNCALYYIQPNALTSKANEGGIVGSYCNFNGDINFTDCTISGGHRIFCTSVKSGNTGKIVLKGTLVQHNGIKTGVLVRCNDVIVGEGSAITFVKATTSIVNDGNVQTDTGGTKYVIFEEGSRMDHKVYNAIKTTETHIRFRDVVDGVETLVLPSQSTQHTIIYDPAGSVDAPFKVVKRTYDESGNETTPKGIDPGTIILQETGFGIKADEILWVAGTNKSKNGYNSSTPMFPTSTYLGWNKQGTLSSVTHGENSMLRYDTTTASPKTTLSYYSGGSEGIVFNSKHVIVMDFDIGTDSELGYPDMYIKYNVRNSTGGSGGDIANIIKIEKNSFTNAATNGDVNASDIAVDRENWMHITFVVYPNVAEDVGSATAAKENGKSYFYINGQLIGTQCAYKAGAGKVYGPRIDIQTTSTLGTSLVIDNVTVRTYDSYKSGESYENQTPTAYFLPEGSYNNGPVKGSGVEIGGVSVKDVNAALTAGAEIGVVPELTADITKPQTVNVNGTINANGHTIALSESSYFSNTMLDENNNPVTYNFHESYSTIKLPVYWVTTFDSDFDEDDLVPMEVGVGEIPTPPTITDVINEETCTATVLSGWTASYWKTAEETFDGEIAPLSLAEIVLIRESYEFVIMTPNSVNKTMTMVMYDSEGKILNYSCDTEINSGNALYKEFVKTPGATFKFLTDIKATGGSASLTKAGTYNVDLNGNVVYGTSKITSGIFSIKGRNVTLNVYSSKPGAALYVGGPTAGNNYLGGVVFSVNAGLSENSALVTTMSTAEPNYNMHLNVGAYGDYPGTNLTVAGDNIFELRQGDKTCSLTVDGANILHNVSDYATAILPRYWSGDITVKNSFFIGTANSKFLGTHGAGTGSKVVAVIDNCVIITPQQNSTDLKWDDSGNQTIIAGSGFEKVTFTNCITNGRMASGNQGAIFYGEGNAAYDHEGSVLEGYVNAKYNVPMTVDMAAINAFLGNDTTANYAKIMTPKSTNGVVDYDIYTYILPYGTTEMPEGFREDKDISVVLPLLGHKTVKADETVTVTWQGLGDNEPVTEAYAKGGNVVGAPTVEEYVGTAVKLVPTGWNESFPENLTESVTMTPTYDAEAIITASVNLSLYSDFAINLYVPKEYAPYITNLEGYNEVTVGDVTYLMTTVNKAVTEATDAVTFTFNIVEGKYTATATATVSIAGYAEAVLKGEAYTAADKQLMYYTVAYAAEAAEYFEKSEDTTLTLTALLTTYADAKGDALLEKIYDNAIDQEKINDTLGDVFRNASISLESAPKFVLTLNDGFAGTVTVSYGGNTKTYTVTETDSRTIVVDGMKAYNFGATLTITAEGTASANGTYNLDTYAAWATSAENTAENAEEVKALVEAFYDYVTVAAQYKAAAEA